MFASDLFGGLKFATVGSGDKLFSGPIWVEQCADTTPWQKIPSYSGPWTGQDKATGDWSKIEKDDHEIVRCE